MAASAPATNPGPPLGIVARRAVELRSAGGSASFVAPALGYESVSAFIAMFKRLCGAPPGKFLARRG
jgi:AraC-like DNA-binding protein